MKRMQKTINMKTQNEFTMSDALKIQRQHLKELKTVLNRETYERLSYLLDERNARGYESPYDVVRGNMLNSIVSNLALQNTGQQDPSTTLIY
jgi:hypothetical protein